MGLGGRGLSSGDPPPEVFGTCTFEEFLNEYDRFCKKWVQDLDSKPFSCEFFTLRGCQVVQVVPANGGKVPNVFFIATKDIAEATSWGRHIPRVYHIIHSKRFGACRVVAVEKVVENTKLFRYIMSTAYMDIKCMRVWHIVRTYHRCTLLALPSESLAESVGSILSDAANKTDGKPGEVVNVVAAAMIRLAGLRGNGGEDGVLCDALNTHFRGEGPKGWHFYPVSVQQTLGGSSRSRVVKKNKMKCNGRSVQRRGQLGSRAQCMTLAVTEPLCYAKLCQAH